MSDVHHSLLNQSSSSSEVPQSPHRAGETALLMTPRPCSPLLPQSSVTVLGSGELGKALASCLSRAGYRVLLASRNPHKTSLRVPSECGSVVSVTEGLRDSDVLVLAVPAAAHPKLPLDIMKNKIIIDVSNRTSNKAMHQHSNIGVSLQTLLPNSHVVKAFNTLSAYALFRGIHQGTITVPYCGNNAAAKCEVARMIRSLGFTPEDRGNIEQAKQIEDIPFSFFPQWRLPIIIAAIVMAFFWIILVIRIQVCPLIDTGGDWRAARLRLLILQEPQLTFSLAAFTLLTLCYAPGVLAAYIQLYRRTKYSQFPNWLDKWLKSRKQLGLIALQIAATHTIAAIVHVILDHDEVAGWQTYSYFICGIFALGLMIVLGITSLPSVEAALSWREFSFVQRYGGWGAMVFVCLHALFVKWETLFTNRFKCVVVADQVQLCMILPALTMLLKLPLLLPWVDTRLKNIRAGVETHPRKL
uniref:Metalloreductase STEAP4 n=1 Tax=Hirondellea gigas TaxID=1518452 RepID=A0A2P2HYS5_9CRUS